MTPLALASLHPKLYHVTEPDAWESIQKHGLLSTFSALALFESSEATRVAATDYCRPDIVTLEHPEHGQLVINDNKPMSEKALHRCLEDGLTPKDWLHILNKHIFFWSSEDGLNRLLNARMNRNRSRLVLVIDTLSLAQNYVATMDICPINSGSTIRKPAKRGKSTFTPLSAMAYRDWQKLRGGRDKIKEVTVLNRIPDMERYVVDKFVTGLS